MDHASHKKQQTGRIDYVDLEDFPKFHIRFTPKLLENFMNKNNLPRLIFLVISFLVIYQSYLINGFAQDITDEDVENSEKRKKIAENEKATAEAKKAKFDALFPKPDVSSLVGGTKINEGTFIETQMLGYCAMKKAASQISEKIDSLNKGNLVVYSEADVKMAARYTLMMNRLKNLKRGYEELKPDYIAEIQKADPTFTLPGIDEIRSKLGDESRRNAAAGLIIDTALKFLSLFKTDVEITPSEITIGERELVAEVFRNLTKGKNGFALYYPQTIPLSIQDCTQNSLAQCSPLLNQLMETSQAYDEIVYLKDRLDKILKAAKALKDKDDEIQKEVERIDKEIAEIDKVINNPKTTKKVKAAKKKEKEKKQKEKADKQNEITPFEEEIRNALDRVDINVDISKLRTFRNNPTLGSKSEILNKIYELTMKELGFGKEKESDKPQAEKPTASPDKNLSQTTTVNVNVGDKEDKKEAGGGSGDKTFVSYLQAESLKNIMKTENDRWLEVKVIKAGGNMRVKSNIITNLAVGSRVNFSGGAIVYYNVYDKDGKSVSSGVVSIYQGYRKSSQINQTCGIDDSLPEPLPQKKRTKKREVIYE